MLSIRTFKNKSPQIGENVFIDPMAYVLGDVKLGDEVSIWPMVAIRGDLEKITIDDRSNVQDGSILHTTRRNKTYPNGFPLTIGKDVTIGHSVTLHGCTIHDRVLVGMGAIVLDGAVIHSDVMIGSGALVPPRKVLESGFLYLGSPVKRARPLSDDEKAFLKISIQNYLKTKDEHLSMMPKWINKND
jgi:carbonic anhydrase/acetyltransferase-like protein (isoleucine patch superfamily)